MTLEEVQGEERDGMGIGSWATMTRDPSIGIFTRLKGARRDLRIRERYFVRRLIRGVTRLGDILIQRPAIVFCLALTMLPAFCESVALQVDRSLFFKPGFFQIHMVFVGLAQIFGWSSLCIAVALARRPMAMTLKVFFFIVLLTPVLGPWIVSLCLHDEPGVPV
jgi:hypothetical protein